MKYTIDYSGITDKTAKEEKAIQDIKDYLGEKSFNDLVEAAKHEPPMSRMLAMFILSFAGISGYPAKIFVEKYLKLKD